MNCLPGHGAGQGITCPPKAVTWPKVGWWTVPNKRPLVLSDPDWRMVAVHNERAERFDEAASAYQLAATEARRRGALAEARGVIDTAIAGLDALL